MGRSITPGSWFKFPDSQNLLRERFGIGDITNGERFVAGLLSCELIDCPGSC